MNTEITIPTPDWLFSLPTATFLIGFIVGVFATIGFIMWVGRNWSPFR